LNIMMSAMDFVTARPFSIAAAIRIVPPGMLSSIGLSQLIGRVFGCGVSHSRASSFSRRSDYDMPPISASWGNPEFAAMRPLFQS
jgi:hypothetical protein